MTLANNPIAIDHILTEISRGRSLGDVSKAMGISEKTIADALASTPDLMEKTKWAFQSAADLFNAKAEETLSAHLNPGIKTVEGRVVLQLANLLQKKADDRRRAADEYAARLEKRNRPRGGWLTRALDTKSTEGGFQREN